MLYYYNLVVKFYILKFRNVVCVKWCSDHHIDPHIYPNVARLIPAGIVLDRGPVLP